MGVITCNSCGSPVPDKDLAKLKTNKSIECKYCRNLIVYNETSSTFMEDLRCPICEGPLREEDLSGKRVCKYCNQDLREVKFNDDKLNDIREALLLLPNEKYSLIQENANLLLTFDLSQYGLEQQDIIRKNIRDLMENIDEVRKSSKLATAKKSIVFIAKVLGVFAGMALVGPGGLAIRAILGLIGPIFSRKK